MQDGPLAGGQIQVADSTPTRDGTDTLTNVEVLQFADQTVLLTSGSAASPNGSDTANWVGWRWR